MSAGSGTDQPGATPERPVVQRLGRHPQRTMPRRRSTHNETERGVFIWVFVFTFVTHIIAGGVWLVLHVTGRA